MQKVRLQFQRSITGTPRIVTPHGSIPTLDTEWEEGLKAVLEGAVRFCEHDSRVEHLPYLHHTLEQLEQLERAKQ